MAHVDVIRRRFNEVVIGGFGHVRYIQVYSINSVVSGSQEKSNGGDRGTYNIKGRTESSGDRAQTVRIVDGGCDRESLDRFIPLRYH